MSSGTPPAETLSEKKTAREQLLPPPFFSPLNLVWICVLPLILLLFINAQAIWLSYGEIKEDTARLCARLVLLANGGVILGLGMMALLLRRTGKTLHSGWFLLLIAVHAAYIWFNLDTLGEALPSSVPDWILNRETLMLAQLACVMPGSFYSLLGFASFPSRLSKGKDMLLSGVLLLGVPLVWYLLMLMARFLADFPSPAVYIAVPFFILSTALMFIGLLRLLIRLHTWLSAYQIALVLIAALVFPLGGLLLNRAIPFPVNFQITGIYVLTVANALVLLAGSLPRLRKNPWIILSQVITFPFTLYFFVVFLPFLPLFIPAMIVMGSGFLILAPTILFMVHAQRLWEGFFSLAGIWGTLRVALAFGAMSAVLPSWFAGQALLDRRTLHQGLDYLYAPKLYPRENFSGSPERMGRVLRNLVDFKEGQYLPLLSDLYNRAVFDNLFLPDTKMQEMHRAFLGTSLPEAKHDRMEDFSIWGGMSNRRMRSEPRMRPLQLPREQAVIESVETLRREDGDCVRHTSVIRIKNNAKVQNEFVTTIGLPEGVLVSNYWLHIGKERVAGRLFEKKTALWVYEQIRDRTRRDPGILRYIGPNTLELRVFPLEAGETRTTEIEFFCPSNLRVEVGINGIRAFHQAAGFSSTARVDYPGGSALMIGREKAGSSVMPVTEQEPYLHFILDHSAAVRLSPDEWLQEVKQIASWPGFSEVRECRVTLTNFESLLLQKEPVPVGEISHLLAGRNLDRLPRRGGFMPDKALREEMLAYETEMRAEIPASFKRYPVFVVVSPENDGFKPGEALPYFMKQGAYPVYAVLKNKPPVPLFSDNGISSPWKRLSVVGRADKKIWVMPGTVPGAWVGYFDPVSRMEIYDPTSGFLPMKGQEILGNRPYAEGLGFHAREQSLMKNPSLRSAGWPDLVYESKASGILIPSTSYIVVENSAQWKILQLKEKQKLSGHEVMELQEAPEPSSIILALLFAVFLRFGPKLFRRKAEGLP